MAIRRKKRAAKRSKLAGSLKRAAREKKRPAVKRLLLSSFLVSSVRKPKITGRIRKFSAFAVVPSSTGRVVRRAKAMTAIWRIGF